MTLTYKSSHSKSQPRGSWKRGRDISMSLIISSACRASAATHGTYATATSSACITLFPHTPPQLTQQITSSSCFISNSLTVPQLLACTLVLLESKWSRLQEKSRAPGLSSECDLVRKLWEKSCLQTLGPWPMSHRVFFENLAERSLPC